MSDSPIFDRMALERGYARLTASRTIPVPEQRQAPIQPDPILDSPVPMAPEEEVYVKPFVKVDGVPRGTQKNVFPYGFETSIPDDMPMPVAKMIHPPEKINDAPGSPRFDSLRARVLGVDPKILQDQFEAHGIMWQDYTDARVEMLNYNFRAVVEAARSMALINQAEGEPRKRIEYSFNPLDLDDSGLSFTDFAHAVVEGFRRGYPEVKDYRFMTNHADIMDNREVFIVEEIVKVTPDTVKDIKPGDHLDILFPKVQGSPLDGVLRDVQATFRAQYPEHVMVAVTDIQEHEDGSATLTVEGQSLAQVKPLSEMETAQHTE